MKIKKEYLILIALIVVLGLYLGLRTRDRTHFELPRPAAQESGALDRLVIARPEGTLELVKKETHWVIEPQGYRADTITIKNMLNQLADLTVTDLVSESESYERYDLNSEKRINVQSFAGGQKTLEFDIGRPAATYQHTFIKLEGDPNVYHARGSLKNTFDQTTENVRDKVVLAFERSDVTAVEIRKGEKSAILSKVDPTAQDPSKVQDQAEQAEAQIPDAQTGWLAEGDRKIDQAVMEQLLSAMSQLKCEGYLEQPVEAPAPAWVLTFKADQQAHSLTLFPKAQGGNRFAAKSSGTPYEFWLPEARVKVFEEQIDHLLGVEPRKSDS
jgi:hypothetical protein